MRLYIIVTCIFWMALSPMHHVKAQNIVVLEINVADTPNVIRVAGVTPDGYIDRIVENIAESSSDTVEVNLFFDWCYEPSSFVIYDTTFALESIYPFHLCVTTFVDTLSIDSPCSWFTTVIDTAQTVCLSVDQILNTENHFSNQKAKLYPNPTEGFLNIDVSQLSQRVDAYIIRDSSGSLLMQGKFNNEVEQLDVSQLPSGVLILELHFESGILRQRFVKLR